MADGVRKEANTSAGHSELAKSERRGSSSSSPEMEKSGPPKVDERGLFDGNCSCTKWERGFGGTAFVDDTEYCQRCKRVLPE